MQTANQQATLIDPTNKLLASEVSAAVIRGEFTMEIMIPVWPETTTEHLATSKVEGLRGVEVALVDDHLDPDYTSEVEKQLTEVYGAIVKKFIKPLGTAPSPKSLIEDAARCTVAVVGMAM